MTPVRPGVRGYRWRRLTPEQCKAIAAAFEAGVGTRALATEYTVTPRTIYRAIDRGRNEVIAEAQVDRWRATYAITDEGPVQLTPWLPLRDTAG